MDPQSQLKKMNESLKKIQTKMNPGLLEPSNLKWNDFLVKVSEISDLYGELIKEIHPGFKNYVTYPTKFDSYDSSSPKGSLLSLDQNNPIVRQREETQEEYQNYIEQNGISEEDTNGRMERVMADINEHNEACKSALEMLTQEIEKYQFANVPNDTDARGDRHDARLDIINFIEGTN